MSASTSLPRAVADQWKPLAVAAVAAVVAVFLVRHTGPGLFREAYFGLVAVLAVTYALRNMEGVSVLG